MDYILTLENDSLKIKINQDQLTIINMLANQEKDEFLNTTFIVNNVRFTIEPDIKPDESKLPKPFTEA